NVEQAEQRMKKYSEIAGSGDNEAKIKQFWADFEDWKKISAQVVAARKEDTPQGRRTALDLTLGQANQAFEKAREHLNTFQELELFLADDDSAVAKSKITSTFNIIVVFTIAAFVFGLVAAWMVVSRLTKALTQISEQLNQSGHTLADTSIRLSDRSKELEDQTTAQAAGLQQTSASVAEITSMVDQN